ncbi:MAG TPA: TPM domain-containing protein [Candidatus Sulfotelmatobacter sp.]|nr:TPM domain-containing protein [Candidatus Sulfotelmatobacter sp.]
MVMRHAIQRLRHAARRLRPARHPHRFFTRAEEHRIVAAIQHAEHETSGRIRVHVEGHCPGDATARAREVFASLGMHRTQQRHGALIYLATKDRKFAVVGDEGIHAAVPPGFWGEIRDAMAGDFRRGRFCEGICHGVVAIGQHLKAYFPGRPEDRNELPDEISTGDA